MLSATLNDRAKKNPNLLTEFPASFSDFFADEFEDGSFLVRFDYSFTDSDYPEMDNYDWVKYRIYTVMDRKSYSKMKDGRYKVNGIYKGFLDKSKLKSKFKNSFNILFINTLSVSNPFSAVWASLGDFYYEDVSVEFIED